MKPISVQYIWPLLFLPPVLGSTSEKAPGLATILILLCFLLLLLILLFFSWHKLNMATADQYHPRNLLRCGSDGEEGEGTVVLMAAAVAGRWRALRARATRKSSDQLSHSENDTHPESSGAIEESSGAIGGSSGAIGGSSGAIGGSSGAIGGSSGAIGGSSGAIGGSSGAIEGSSGAIGQKAKVVQFKKDETDEDRYYYYSPTEFYNQPTIQTKELERLLTSRRRFNNTMEDTTRNIALSPEMRAASEGSPGYLDALSTDNTFASIDAWEFSNLPDSNSFTSL